jgi:RNA polymerase sigma-70 factor (ECF subfamily)
MIPAGRGAVTRETVAGPARIRERRAEDELPRPPVRIAKLVRQTYIEPAATTRKLTFTTDRSLPDWQTIVREQGPMAYRTAWRILGHVQDTEDAVQEAFLEVLRAVRQAEVSNAGGLVRRVVTWRALDRLRQRKTTAQVSEEIPAPAAEQPGSVVETRELAERLRGLLCELPPRQAEVFSLRHFGELSNPEIAAALDISVEAVAVALHKARAALAAHWNRPANALGSQRP